MNETNRYARRYHWLGESICDFTCEPHAAICGGRVEKIEILKQAVESAKIGDRQKMEAIKRLKGIEDHTRE